MLVLHTECFLTHQVFSKRVHAPATTIDADFFQDSAAFRKRAEALIGDARTNAAEEARDRDCVSDSGQSPEI